MYVSFVYLHRKHKSHLKSHLVIIWKSISYKNNKQINKSLWSAGQIILRKEHDFMKQKFIFGAEALLEEGACGEFLCPVYSSEPFSCSTFPAWELKEDRVNLSGSINRGTCPSTAEDLFQDLHITEKNYKAEINTSPIITHCRLGSIPRFPWLFVLIKCLHGT